VLNNCLSTTQRKDNKKDNKGKLDSHYKTDDKEGNGARSKELQGKDNKHFLLMFKLSCNHYEHVTSQPVDRNLVSESGSALRNFTNQFNHLKHDQQESFKLFLFFIFNC